MMRTKMMLFLFLLLLAGETTSQMCLLDDLPCTLLDFSSPSGTTFDYIFLEEVWILALPEEVELDLLSVTISPVSNQADTITFESEASPTGSLTQPLASGMYNVEYMYPPQDCSITCELVILPGPTCSVTCPTEAIELSLDELENQDDDALRTTFTANAQGNSCGGEPPTLTFTDNTSSFTALTDITTAGSYNVIIDYGIGPDGITTCPDSLTVCAEPTKSDLICPELNLDGDNEFLTTCDLPVTLTFDSQTDVLPAQCAEDITVKFAGCSVCTKRDEKKKSYTRGCSVHHVDDDSTNEFTIESVGLDATYLRFVMRAGNNARRTCRYCIEKIPRGQCRKKKKNGQHVRKLTTSGGEITNEHYDEQEETHRHRELTYPRSIPARDMTCRKNGKCKKAPNFWD